MSHQLRDWGASFARGLAALFAALVVGAGAARAEGDAYTITGVKVQASGVKPELARAKAVADGEMAALTRLLRKLTLPEDFARVPKPSPDAVRAAVLNFSIESDNQQGDKYTASVTYRFDRDAVRGMLDAANVPYIDNPSPPIVVLTLWAHEGKPLLWDDPNPWREAWLRLEPSDTLATFARLRGDLEDLKAISAAEAAAGNRAALGKVADQYKAGLVAVANATVDKKNQRRITLHLFDLASGRMTGLGLIPAGEDAAALDKAAAQVARLIDMAWKRSAVTAEQNAVVVRVRAPIENLEHWIKIRQALQGMPQLRNLTTISMTPGEALIELRFAGTLAELKRQLEQKGMSLAPDPAAGGTEVWLLRAPSAPPAPPPPKTPGVKETDLPPPGTPPASAPPGQGEPPKKP